MTLFCNLFIERPSYNTQSGGTELPFQLRCTGRKANEMARFSSLQLRLFLSLCTRFCRNEGLCRHS